MKKLIRKAVDYAINKSWDRSMAFSERTARFTMRAGKRMKEVGHLAYVVGRVQTEAIADIQKHRDEHVQLSVDLYVAILTFDKEAVAEIMAAQLEKGFQKAKEKPPAWATDMNAMN